MYSDTKSITRDQETFYNTLFSNNEGYAEIRLIDQQGNVQPLFLTLKELQNYPTPTDSNVYIGVFQRSKKGDGTIKSCNFTNAIWLDFDDMELEEIKYSIDMEGIPQPSMIINSGHGYHVYWLLDKPRGHEVKPILDKLASLLHADTRATDIARVLRVPDTMNVKGEAVACTLIECNGHTTSLERFEKCLGIKASKPQETKRTGGIIAELASIKFNGLNNMASGVGKGERNFCTGRIVQTLRRLNYTKQETMNIVFRWNQLNRPIKDTKELQQDINTFWYEYADTNRLRYDGKEFSDTRLQELNKRFISDDTTFFKGETLHSYDNELLKPENFRADKKKVNGLTLAILSIIKLAESEGIRREHIADLCKRNLNDKNIRVSLKLLQDMKYIKVIKRDRINFYVFTEKANYNRGYTSVSKMLHRSFLNKEIKEHEYKMMVLLESYAFDDKQEIYPSNDTLAYRLGCTDRNVKNILKQLQHKQFIKVEFKKGKRYIHLIYR